MTTQQIVDLLNDAYKADPNAIDALLCASIPCNNNLVNHPSIQIRAKNNNGDFPVIGILGLLNGIVAIDDDIIETVYDSDTHCLIRFQIRCKISN